MKKYYRRYPWPESWDKWLFGLLWIGALGWIARWIWQVVVG